MKKEGVCIILLIAILSFAFVMSVENTSNSSTNQTSNNSSTSSSISQTNNSNKVEKAFSCLENKVKGTCSSLSIPEIAFTILASPSSSILDECKKALISKKDSQNCWPSGSCKIKDTALAVLALAHIGENTKDAEKWLISKNQTSKDIIWYLQQDSEGVVQCKISYAGNDFTINIDENKKIDNSAGSCLSLTSSKFWLQVSPDCYDQEFAVSCNKDFIASLFYKHPTSPIIYPLSDTKSATGLSGVINLKIRGKCLADSNNCDYEPSLWAVLALVNTGNVISDFIPYLSALEDSNKKYLPDSFLYQITEEQYYANKLIQEQVLGNHWEADSTAYNKFYDTALALIALRHSTAEQVSKAKDWAYFQQDSSGCWKNSNSDKDMIRDTAILLWALEGRTPGKITPGGVTYCESADFFCIKKDKCPSNEQLNNYYCSGSNSVCCKKEYLDSCSDLGGKLCSSDKECSGNSMPSKEGECCLDQCVPKATEETCSDKNYSCRTKCNEGETEVFNECASGQVCCKPGEPSSSYWWLWVLIAGIVIVLGIILFLIRDKLKLFLFKLKSKFKKDKGSPQTQTGTGFPPRPGFSPIVRQPIRPIQTPLRRPTPSFNKSKNTPIDDVFKKLKDMSK